MKLNDRVNEYVDNGVLVFEVHDVESAEFFDDPAAITDEVVKSYEAHVDSGAVSPSCVVVIKARSAPSPLIRLIYRLFKACRKRRASLFVCDFPDEYIVSLRTLALMDQEGFEIARTREDAVRRIGPVLGDSGR